MTATMCCCLVFYNHERFVIFMYLTKENKPRYNTKRG